MNLNIVILAGGEGKRLWPLVYKGLSKPLLKIKNGKTLLEETIDRFSSLGKVYAVMTKEQIQEAKLIIPREKINYIEEDDSLGTAVAMKIAAQNFQKEELILFTAADQMIEKPEQLISAIVSAMEMAQKGKIVLFGTKPTFANTQFGYFLLGKDHQIDRFIEKPTYSEAVNLIKMPNTLWHMGICLMRADRMVKAWEHHFSPDLPSFEHSILMNDKNIYAHEIDTSFFDVGSFESLEAFYTSKEENNFVHGNVQTLNVENCLIYSEDLPIKILEVSDLIVIATPKGILISKKGHSHQQKNLI